MVFRQVPIDLPLKSVKDCIRASAALCAPRHGQGKCNRGGWRPGKITLPCKRAPPPPLHFPGFQNQDFFIILALCTAARNLVFGEKDQGSEIKDQGSRTKDQGPRTKDQGRRTKVKYQESRIMDLVLARTGILEDIQT